MDGITNILITFEKSNLITMNIPIEIYFHPIKLCSLQEYGRMLGALFTNELNLSLNGSLLRVQCIMYIQFIYTYYFDFYITNVYYMTRNLLSIY